MNKVGYALIAIGVVALIVWGAIEFLADPAVEPIIKVAVVVVFVGIGVLLAKVARDRLLCALDLEYPGYGFAGHKGYPTRAHLEALRRLGPCPEHRRSFAPVRAVIVGAAAGDRCA